MALVTIENTREHDITLHIAAKDGEQSQVTIPGARQSASDKNEIVNGSAQVEDTFIAEAKKNKVVAHYFDEGWLVLPKKAAPKTPAADGAGKGKAGAADGAGKGNDE